MKTVIFFLLSLQCISEIVTEDCQRPQTSLSKRVYIYSSLKEVNVTVYQCDFKNENGSFVDITDRCADAFKTGWYTDSVGNKFNFKTNSYFQFKKFNALADPLRNEIHLPFGTVRYDRGVSPGPNLAIWEVSKVHSHNLDEIFNGNAFIWSFKNKEFFIYKERLNFYYLELKTKGELNGKDIWFSNIDGILLSFTKLNSNTQSGDFKKYLPVKPTSTSFVKSVLEICDQSNSQLHEKINNLEKEFDDRKVLFEKQKNDFDNMSKMLINTQSNVANPDIVDKLKIKLSADVNKLSSKQIQQDTKIADLNTSLKEKHLEIGEITKKCVDAQTKSLMNHKIIMELQKNLLDLQSNCSNTNKELRLVQKQFTDEYIQIKEKDMVYESKTAEQDAQNKKVNLELKQKEIEIAKLISKCDINKNNTAKNELEISYIKKRLQQVQDQLSKKEQEFKILEKTYRDANFKLQATDAKCEKILEEVEKNKNNYESLKSSVSEIEYNMQSVNPV